MNIILDTNIIRGNIPLNSNSIEILLNYLKKTNSKILMPDVILEELRSGYSDKLFRDIKEYNNAVDNLGAITKKQKVNKIHLTDNQKENEINSHIDFIFTRLNITQENIIKYKNEYLSEALKRAIYKKKPFNVNGKGLQDTIIWLTLLEYCSSLKEKQIVFISENIKDFGISGKLDVELENECMEKGIKVYYFKDLLEFIKDHNSMIEFITEEWLYTLFDKQDVKEKISTFLETDGQAIFISYYEDETKHKFTGFTHVTHILDIHITEFFIYEMISGDYVVYVPINVLVEIDFLKEGDGKHYVNYVDTKSYPIDLVVSIKINAQKKVLNTEITF